MARGSIVPPLTCRLDFITWLISYYSMVHSIWKKKNTYWNSKIIFPTWFTRNPSKREMSTTSKYGKRRQQREDNSMKYIQVSNTLFKRAQDRPQAYWTNAPNWALIVSAGVIYSRLFNYTQHTACSTIGPAPPNVVSERTEHFLVDMIIWLIVHLPNNQWLSSRRKVWRYQRRYIESNTCSISKVRYQKPEFKGQTIQ